MAFILQSLEKFRTIQKQTANTAAHTAAHIADGMFSYMGQGKSKLAHKDFLPYTILSDGEQNKRLTRQSAAVFAKLYERGSIPPQVLAAMGKYFEDCKGFGL